MPNLTDQLTMPGLDEFTGLTASQYIARLLDLVLKCQSMDPDRYLRELDHLSRLRQAGRMSEGQKQGFHALEGLAEISADRRQREEQPWG